MAVLCPCEIFRSRYVHSQVHDWMCCLGLLSLLSTFDNKFDIGRYTKSECVSLMKIIGPVIYARHFNFHTGSVGQLTARYFVMSERIIEKSDDVKLGGAVT
jgi:hypothetical protein